MQWLQLILGACGEALTEKNSGLRGQIVRVASEGLAIGETAGIMSEVAGLKIGWKIKANEELEALNNAHPLVASQL